MISYVESFNVFGAITVDFHPKSENKFKNLLESGGGGLKGFQLTFKKFIFQDSILFI